jgi:hypothetical protein
MICDKPMAAKGYISYRYRGRYGWIMIGALNDADALNEAGRSLNWDKPVMSNLERWNGECYVAFNK